MKIFWPLLLLCSHVLVATGQVGLSALSDEAYVDSLVRELPKHANDTSKVKLLTTVSFMIDGYDSKEGVRYGETALALAEMLGWTEGIARACNSLGNNHITLGNNRIAMGYYSRALEIYDSLGDKKGRAQALGNIAMFYYGISDYVKALAYWLDALRVFEQIDDKLGIANQLGNIAMLYQEQGKFAKSILYTQRAMSLFHQLGNKDAEAMQLGNLANTYDKMGNANDALATHIATLAMYETIGNNDGKARTLMNMGISYFGKRQYTVALDCQFKALEIYKLLNSADGLGLVYSNLAEEYYKIAVDTEVVIPGKYVYTDKKKCLQMAMEYAGNAIEYHRVVNSLTALSYTYRVMANIQIEMGQAKQAKTSYELYEAFRDSVFTIDNNLKIAGLDWKRELELKDKQIELDRLAVQKKRNERVFFIAGVVFLLGSGVVVVRNIRLKAAKELSENKLNAFQARMNPHFIFNALSSIQSLIMNNENERSIDYLSEFAVLMRQVLDNSLKSKVLLKTEIEMLRSYIELEHLRFDCFDWEVVVGESVAEDMVEIPGMIIQPFVENSILHGLTPKGNGGQLTITFERSDKHIICTVDDNGIGRAKSAELNKNRNKNRQSHGISIAVNRLELLNDKRKKLVNTISYIDKEENSIAAGTKVIIELPIL